MQKHNFENPLDGMNSAVDREKDRLIAAGSKLQRIGKCNVQNILTQCEVTALWRALTAANLISQADRLKYQGHAYAEIADMLERESLKIIMLSGKNG